MLDCRKWGDLYHALAAESVRLGAWYLCARSGGSCLISNVCRRSDGSACGDAVALGRMSLMDERREKGQIMNRLLSGILVLTFLGGVLALTGTATADVPEAWKSLDGEGLADLSKELKDKGDDGKAERALLAQHVVGRFLGDEDKTRSVRLSYWGRMAEALGADATASVRTTWASGLRSAFGEAELVSSDFSWLCRALEALGDQQLGLLAATRITKTTSWKSWNAHHLADSLASRIRYLGDSGKAARVALAAHIQSKHLATKDEVRKVRAWPTLVAALVQDLSASNRVLWATKLQEAFIDGAEDLAKARSVLGTIRMLDPDRVAMLASTLDSASATALVKQVTETTGWKSRSPAELLVMADRLVKLGDPAKQARGAIAGHIQAKYLASASAAQSVSVQQWDGFVRLLQKELSAGSRALWSAKLREAFAQTNLSLSEFYSYRHALEALGYPDGTGLLAAWVSGGTQWKSHKPSQLVGVARELATLGDSGKQALGMLAEHVTSKYLLSAATTRSVSLGNWAGFAQALKSELSAETVGLWADRVQGAYLNNELSPRAFGFLEAAVTSLDKDRGAALPAMLVKDTTAWKSWPLRALVPSLISRLKADAASSEARALIVKHIGTTIVPSPAAVRKVDCKTWSVAVSHLAPAMSPETRVTWIKGLRAGFAGATLDSASIRSLAHALKALGDTDTAAFVTTLTQQSSQWESLPTQSLPQLAVDFARSGSLRACVRLADHISTKYLASAESTRLLTCEQWGSLVASLESCLSAEQKGQWASKLQAAFAAQDDLKTLPFKQLRGLGRALALLDEKAASNVAVAWFKAADQTTLNGLKATDMTSVASLLSSADAAQRAELMAGFDQRWEAGHASEPLPWQQSCAVSYAWLRMKDLDKAKAWSMRAYEAGFGTEEARNAATVATLGAIANVLDDTGLIGKGKGYPGYAAAVARLAREGKLADLPRFHYHLFAVPLGTPATRQTVQAELIDSEGHVRVGVAKLLTWACRDVGEFKSWQSLLDEKVAEAPAGDAKALWLMAKAFTEQLRPLPIDLKRGYSWLDKALAEAKSEPVRLRAVRELAGYYESVNFCPVGISALESIKGQFSPSGSVEIVSIQARLAKAHSARLAAAGRKKRQRVLQQSAAMLRYFQGRLRLAERRGDQGQATKLRAEIAKLES